jgi:hypothetical protein
MKTDSRRCRTQLTNRTQAIGTLLAPPQPSLRYFCIILVSSGGKVLNASVRIARQSSWMGEGVIRQLTVCEGKSIHLGQPNARECLPDS